MSITDEQQQQTTPLPHYKPPHQQPPHPFNKPEQQHWLWKCCICMFYNQYLCWILLQHKIIKSSFIVFSLLLMLLFACRFKLNKDSTPASQASAHGWIFSTTDDQAGPWMETMKMTMTNKTALTSSWATACGVDHWCYHIAVAHQCDVPTFA